MPIMRTMIVINVHFWTYLTLTRVIHNIKRLNSTYPRRCSHSLQRRIAPHGQLSMLVLCCRTMNGKCWQPTHQLMHASSASIDSCFAPLALKGRPKHSRHFRRHDLIRMTPLSQLQISYNKTVIRKQIQRNIIVRYH